MYTPKTFSKNVANGWHQIPSIFHKDLWYFLYASLNNRLGRFWIVHVKRRMVIGNFSLGVVINVWRFSCKGWSFTHIGMTIEIRFPHIREFFNWRHNSLYRHSNLKYHFFDIGIPTLKINQRILNISWLKKFVEFLIFLIPTSLLKE